MRQDAGLSKAALARAISSEPATVRRLFSAAHVNPTLGTLAEVAAVLGMRVVLEPMGTDDVRQITEPLRRGSVDDPYLLAKGMKLMREQGRELDAACQSAGV
jgi:transcriptional regulator with XRE-family HTH domain